MPLYEYECDACQHRFEVIQKFSDPPVEKCPKCGSTVRKLHSAPAIQFKGTGWYITDYARKGQETGSKTVGKDSSSSSSAEKTDSSTKAEKSETTDKGEKAEKTDKGTKDDKSTKPAASDSTPSSSSKT